MRRGCGLLRITFRGDRLPLRIILQNCPICELFTRVEHMPGSSIYMLWWDQDLNPEEEGGRSIKGDER